jgi:hypothetical protein
MPYGQPANHLAQTDRGGLPGLTPPLLLNFLSAAGEAYETETEEGGIDRKNLDTSFVDLGWGNRTTPPLSLALQR